MMDFFDKMDEFLNDFLNQVRKGLGLSEPFERGQMYLFKNGKMVPIYNAEELKLEDRTKNEV
jgi:hypothetical protein